MWFSSLNENPFRHGKNELRVQAEESASQIYMDNEALHLLRKEIVFLSNLCFLNRDPQLKGPNGRVRSYSDLTL